MLCLAFTVSGILYDFPDPYFYRVVLTTASKQCDDLILRKVNSSDASVFARKYGGSSQCWGVIWSLISLLFMIAAIIAGIAAFHESFSQQESDSKDFIPTR